jgi:opacity protein-like surface antigen
LKRLVLYATIVSAAASSASAQNVINWPQNFAWQIDTGADYSSGRYGSTTDTNVLSIPIEGKVQLDRFRLEASLPYLDVKGPGVLAGGVVVGNGPVTTRSGIGDLNLGAAYLLSKDAADSPAIEVEGFVKVPTAGTNLGTGKYDYAVQANIYHSFTPRFMLFGSAGYQWLTSFSTYTLKSGVTATAGANYRASDDVSVGVSGSFRQEYYAGLGDAFTVSPYVLWTFDPHWRISTYGTFGSGKASPKYGFGMRLILFQS